MTDDKISPRIAVPVNLNARTAQPALGEIVAHRFRCDFCEVSFHLLKQLWPHVVGAIVRSEIINVPIRHEQFLRAVIVNVDELRAKA